ncbi:uncharacterized protein LOC143369420 [Andrena cerasifolii]|uniref:uncharacterized protein LOC143369420 n=1 Tax=Andrena cerasifolii TaxID=2819439 RepID=UPI0040380E0E
MTEFLNGDINEVGENVNNRADRINYLIKQLTGLTEAINKNKNDQHFWESQSSGLSASIWAHQIKYNELEKVESQMRNDVSTATKVIDFKQQELRDLRTKRAEYFSKQCDNFRARSTNYTDKILRAPEAYSTANLLKDIEQYREEYKHIERTLPTLKKKLENLETRCGLNCLNSVDVKEILEVDMILNDITKVNENKMQEIQLAQNTLKTLKEEIKQKTTSLNDFRK